VVPRVEEVSQLDFIPMMSDACLFRHQKTGGLILVYIDDLLVIGRDLETVIQFAKLLKSRFKMRDIGDVKFFLGCRKNRDREAHKLWLCQDSYIEGVV
jgi:hypothetical protein